MALKCTDSVVGDILATWRYDISGLAPEMRGAYEEHLAECERCINKQRLHRTIDIGLVVIASMSAAAFLAAFGIVRHYQPHHALYLEIAGLGGFAFSAFMWLAVLLATPAPIVITGAARMGARVIHDRLPENVRERVPERLWEKIS
jgi:anti-sigma factor RsiW